MELIDIVLDGLRLRLRGWLLGRELSRLRQELRREAREGLRELARELSSPPLLVRSSLLAMVDEPYRIFDHRFPEPHWFSGFLDLSALDAGEAARVGVFIGVRGDGESDLLALPTREEVGPLKEAYFIEPMLVAGRVVVTYRQLTGVPKPVRYLFLAAPVQGAQK